MTQQCAPQSEQACAIVLRLLKEFQTIDSAFPLQYAICLLEIARDEGLSLTTLASRTNMPLSTVSRIIGALSNKRQKGQAFYLIDVQLSDHSRRLKEIRLSPRGRSIIRQIEALAAQDLAQALSRVN